MEQGNKKITITASINESAEQVWTCWNEPKHITQWCSASPDWHTPRAENDLRIGGRFLTRMEAKDGSFGFDFSGTYTDVVNHKYIAYTLDDNRTVSIQFDTQDGVTNVEETFEMENENPEEMQRMGWQAILDKFKNYVELTK
ncbi:MAG: SRPBCC domain-containing protein [Chitinophagaceae bacterium]|nr:SRPBCC domain-containing protein [Chitinophagaceae bacterium]